MRAFVSMVCLAGLLATTTAMADGDLLGKDFVTSPSGQPFCTDKDQLQEYVLAALKNDQKWLESLDTCATVNGGLKVSVIEDYPGSDLGHVVKARVFGTKGSMVGYTLSLGLVSK